MSEETVALLITGHSATDKYIPLVRGLIKEFWPDRPYGFFLTDGSQQAAQDVISFPGLSWIELFERGLDRIKETWPQTTHVFHILEDHCPLRSCDGVRLKRILAIADRRDFAAVAFPTYSWPWHEIDTTEYPDGLVRTWRRKDIIQFDGEIFAVVPRKFFRYFQVQPTVWRLDYLREVCAYAASQGIVDAWGFEAMQWKGGRQHYVSRYDWPTVHHGFLAQGRLNPAAIAYLDRERVEGAHRLLVREAIGIESPFLFDSLQLFARTKRSIRSSIGGIKRRFRQGLGMSPIGGSNRE